MQVINSLIFMVISKGSHVYPIHVNRLYLGLFRNFPQMGFFGAFSRHIEDTKSVEFASVAIYSNFFS